jgi:molybdate transport system ATP-binding protein
MLDFDLSMNHPLPLRATAHTAAQWLGVLGQSGAGKTSLLRSIAGIAPGDCRLILDGDAVAVRTRHQIVSLVCQQPPLVPHWTVKQHLKRVMARHGESTLSGDIIDALEVRALRHLRPHALSGGQRRRVALTLALLRHPRLLLLDEPFAALDAAGRRRLFPRMRDITRRMGCSVMLVAHQIDDVARLCDEVAILEGGRITYCGALLEGIRRYQGLSSPCSILHGTSVTHNEQGDLLAVSLGEQTLWLRSRRPPLAGSRVRAMVHADEIAISIERPGQVSLMNQLGARVTALILQSGGVIVDCQCEGQSIQARITRSSLQRLDIKEGDELFLLFKASAVELLGVCPGQRTMHQA